MLARLFTVFFLATLLVTARAAEGIKPTPNAHTSKSSKRIPTSYGKYQEENPDEPENSLVVQPPQKAVQDNEDREPWRFRVIDVKHLYLDLNINPGPVDFTQKAVFQDNLAKNPSGQYGKRFFIHWGAEMDGSIPEVIVRLELRGLMGNVPTSKTVEFTYPDFREGSEWTEFDFVGDEYKKFGQLTAWRVTVLTGNKVLARKKSILWK